MDELEKFCYSTNFKKNYGVNNALVKRNASGTAPRMGLYGTTKVIQTQKIQDTIFKKQNPDLGELLKRIADEHFPDHIYTHVQINHNFRCLPHKDKKNVGDTYIFCLGVYDGGELVIEGDEYNIYKKPHCFNGNKLLHWTNEFNGERFAIIYFNSLTV